MSLPIVPVPAPPAGLPPSPGPLNYSNLPPPGRRRFAIGEIIAWLIVIAAVTFVAIRASMAQYREAAEHGPDIMMPLRAQYAVGLHELIRQAKPEELPGLTAQLMAEMDKSAETPEDQLRVAMVAGELLGADEAGKRLDAIAAGTPALADDAATARAIVQGHPVPDAARAALAQKYPWFVELLASRGKPASDPQRAATLERPYFVVALVWGGIGLFGLLGIAGLALAIIALVRLALGKFKRAFSRGIVPETGQPADRRCYIYGMAAYLGGYVGLALLLRWIIQKLHWPEELAYLALLCGFTAGLLLPLAMGQSVAQWRQTLGLHTGRGILREMGGGIVGYIAGIPLLVVGGILVAILSAVSGLRGAHPIVQELGGSWWDLFMVFLLACVFAPVSEELMFRGALFAHLRERFSWWISALVMGVLFALLHPQSWVALPVLAAIAVTFAGIREWRGSIIGSMTAHAMHNGIALAVSVMLLR